jgi:hypothetical protein
MAEGVGLAPFREMYGEPDTQKPDTPSTDATAVNTLGLGKRWGNANEVSKVPFANTRAMTRGLLDWNVGKPTGTS